MKTRIRFAMTAFLLAGTLLFLASCALLSNLPAKRVATPAPAPSGTPVPPGSTPSPQMVEVVLRSAADSPNLAYFAIYDAAGKEIFQTSGAPASSYKLYVPIGVYTWVAQAPIPTQPLWCFVIPADYGFSKEGSFTAEKEPVTIEVKLGRILVPCTATPTVVTPTTRLCPVATQEPQPRVAPVTSPTSELSQIIWVRPGRYDQVTVETESGTFTAPFDSSAGIKIDLLPNTLHHLTVTVHIRETNDNGCKYGGYNMSVSQDENGQPLVIVQGNPRSPSPVTEAIGPDTFGRVKQLASIAFSGGQRPWGASFPQADLLATYGFGQGVQRWQLPSGQSAGDWMLNNESMTISTAFSRDGTWMATGSAGWQTDNENQTSVRLWNLITGQVRLLGHHSGTVESLAFSPSGSLLASGGNDNTVLVWDVTGGSQVAKFEGDVVTLSDGSKLIQGMRQLFWDGDTAVIARGDAVMYKWSVPSGERLVEIGGEYQDLSFDPNTGRMGMVRETGVYMKVPDSNPSMLLLAGGEASRGYQQVTFSPDGKLLAALNDTTMTFWDAETKQVLASGQNPVGARAVFSPDWRYLARVSWDHYYVSVWGVQP